MSHKRLILLNSHLIDLRKVRELPLRIEDILNLILEYRFYLQKGAARAPTKLGNLLFRKFTVKPKFAPCCHRRHHNRTVAT